MNNHEEVKQIKKLIETYAAGTYEADTDKLKSVFHEKAVMNGYLGENILLGDPKPFIEDIGQNPSMKSQGAKYNAEIEYMNVEENIATVIVSETAFRGDGAMVNHFHLIKTDGSWKIISKLFTTL